MTLDTRFAINCRVLDSFNSCVHYIWHTQPYTNLTIQTTDQVRWNYAEKNMIIYQYLKIHKADDAKCTPIEIIHL